MKLDNYWTRWVIKGLLHNNVKNLTRQLLFSIFFLSTFCLEAQNIKVAEFSSFNEWLFELNNIRLENPEYALKAFEEGYEYFLENKDTLNAVNTLVEMAVMYGHQVKYQSAYDNLWKALFLADLGQNDIAKVSVYIQLGRYYSFYKRKETALKYLQQALNLCKKLHKDGKVTNDLLASCYYAFCSTHRDFKNGESAQLYLDSCYLYNSKNPESTVHLYLTFEAACINNFKGEYQQAIDSLKNIQPWFEQNSPGFQVLLFTHIGDNYLALGQQDQAEEFYKLAIQISEKYKSHNDFVPTIYQRLANLYKDKKDYNAAFLSLKKEQELDAVFFDSRSENNRSLLEIKDEYRIEKENQKRLLQEQKIANFEQEKRVNMLKNTLLLVSFCFLAFAGFLYLNYIRKKHKVEKDLIKKKKELEMHQANELRELERKKANELLELKNKELATSSLKLIEKDEVLATLKERLSQGNGDLKSTELKKIVRSISSSNAQNWEEFETRFMSVNKEFYSKLNQKYPKLSRGDQKLCALVKLNLSSKEMAKLLGISIESVHTNRYRLRKKLALTREVSLTEFVATL